MKFLNQQQPIFNHKISFENFNKLFYNQFNRKNSNVSRQIKNMLQHFSIPIEYINPSNIRTSASLRSDYLDLESFLFCRNILEVCKNVKFQHIPFTMIAYLMTDHDKYVGAFSTIPVAVRSEVLNNLFPNLELAPTSARNITNNHIIKNLNLFSRQEYSSAFWKMKKNLQGEYEEIVSISRQEYIDYKEEVRKKYYSLCEKNPYKVKEEDFPSTYTGAANAFVQKRHGGYYYIRQQAYEKNSFNEDYPAWSDLYNFGKDFVIFNTPNPILQKELRGVDNEFSIEEYVSFIPKINSMDLKDSDTGKTIKTDAKYEEENRYFHFFKPLELPLFIPKAELHLSYLTL